MQNNIADTQDVTGGSNSGQEQAYQGNFGLAEDQPVTVEGIIRGAFSNPDRTKYPDPDDMFGWKGTLRVESSAESLIERIRSTMLHIEKKFNDEKIRTHDVSGLYEENGWEEPVSASDYLETIKSCGWCGPYEFSEDKFIFYTINKTGKNGYWAEFIIDLPPGNDIPGLQFHFSKNHSGMRSSYFFND